MQNLIELAQKRIDWLEFLERELTAFIIFDVILGLMIVIIFIICPYACARACCKSKFAPTF